MVCKKCGNQLNDSARFCPKCGQRTEYDQQVQNAQTQTVQKNAYNNTHNMNNSGGAMKGHGQKKKRKAPAIIIAVVVIIGFLGLIGRGGSSSSDSVTTSSNGNAVPADSGNTAVADGIDENGSLVSSVEDENAQTLGKRGTNLSITSDGKLSITRITDDVAPMEMPDDGIWTVYVYMCGANLESVGGCATDDLQEMFNATLDNSNLRFVVEAGGADVWQNDHCADGQNTRLLISGGAIQATESETANMGDPNTLFNFLDWGLANYCSQYTVLDFWDHGGASIGGVCTDERYNGDGLSLMEIDETLAALYTKYAFKYEVIGCDACLMSTIETANILTPYANYMIASEELEPATGWEYAGFGKGVKAEVKNGAELGKFLCDDYISSVPEKTKNTLTLSVIDLSKIDQFLMGFNSYCIDIYDYICNQNGIDDIMSGARDLPSFGSGDPNSTDLGLFLKSTSAYSARAESALTLMNECVVYMRNGNAYNDVGGIAVYFPLTYSMGSQHCNILKDICVTPFYMGIVDVCAYGKDNVGDISGYDSSQWVDEDSEYWSGNDIEYGNPADDSPNTSEMNTNRTGITFSVEPHCEKGNFDVFGAGLDLIASFALGENLASEHMEDLDKYSFTFSDEGLKNVDTIYTDLIAEIDINGRALLTDMGFSFVGDGEYYRQNNQKTVAQPFLGVTVGLDNGNILAFYPLTRRYVEGYGYVNFYYAPVRHNDQKKYLIFYEYYIEQDPNTWVPTARTEYIAVGTVDMNSGDFASRLEPLKEGDSIVALYEMYDRDTLEFVDYMFFSGQDSYICQEDGDFRLRANVQYPNGVYRWMYCINDIYGNTLYTSAVTCTVDHDQLWPYSIDD